MTTGATTSAEAHARAQRLPFPMQENEQLLMLARRHWVYLWPRTVLYVLFALVPIIVAGWLVNLADQLDGTVAQVFTVAALLWALFWGIRIFLNWYRYNNDIWVVTNQRIVDSFKSNPFKHRISTADLVNVQDMTVERNGILQTALNYGDVVCETAGAGGRHEFRLVGIPRPSDVQLFMDKERDRERTRGRP